MEMLAHQHPLTLVDMNPEYPHEKEVYEDEEDLFARQAFQNRCHRCNQEIIYLHRYYYKCDQCYYSLHQLCGELLATLKHASHSEHTLTLFLDESDDDCDMCKSIIKRKKLKYHCSRCMFNICLDCSMDSKQYHTIYHPSHKHPLIPTCNEFIGGCDACGGTHDKWVFYQCITCFRICLHKDCVFQPKMLLLQDVTNDKLFHTHPLTLTFSFPIKDQKAKFNPTCRICNKSFSEKENLWLYKCEKCRYYAHIECVTYRWPHFLKRDIYIPSIRSAKDNSLLFPIAHLPFSDGTYNKLKEFLFKETNNNEMRLIDHGSHQHPLILVGTHTHTTTTLVEDLCDGCVTPIKNDIQLPYYKCTSSGCNFLLHALCTRLPTKSKFGHFHHPEHTLILMPKVRRNSLGSFQCSSCDRPCKGFAYSCVDCHYIFDVRCAFLPNKITHKSHPPHLLYRNWGGSVIYDYCRICLSDLTCGDETSYHCYDCSFSLHPECAMLFPDTITHKYDKHSLTLTYGPVEDHGGDYFCEVCEEELNPYIYFYHCHRCAQSIHLACAPIPIPPTQGKPFIHGPSDYYANIRGTVLFESLDHIHPLSIPKRTQGI